MDTKTFNKSTIAVALSGGVDSAVAAAILKEQGHSLIGVTMDLLSTPADTLNQAEQVAEHLGIPLHRIDLRNAFEQQIVTPFANAYLNGETPNPCVRCNSLVKFGLLLEYALKLGASRLATGHYARVLADPEGQFHLLAACDRRKDQSYFLATIGQQALSCAVFPLGDMPGKGEVREMARNAGIPVAASKESQDVCFIPDEGYGQLLASRPGCPSAKGLIVHRSGRLLGRHNGFWRFTVGQRKGLGISWKEPLYVLDVQAGRNRVVVGEEQFLYSCGLTADQAVWFGPLPRKPFEASCKIRYRHSPVPCRVEPQPGDIILVHFQDPQRAVTPGQTVVIYDGEEVLGAARIKEPAQSC